MTRYDLLSPRKGRNDKTHWHKVGTAFPQEKGGFSLVFDSLPLADEKGEVRLMMWEAKPRDDAPQQRQERRQEGGYGRGPDMEDSIPFAPEVR